MAARIAVHNKKTKVDKDLIEDEELIGEIVSVDISQDQVVSFEKIVVVVSSKEKVLFLSNEFLICFVGGSRSSRSSLSFNEKTFQ